MTTETLNFNLNYFNNRIINATDDVYKLNFSNHSEDGQIRFYSKKNDIILKINKSKSLTIKNAHKCEKIIVNSELIDNYDVLGYNFKPTRKKNKYTGSAFNESAYSTSASETFSLGTGKDTVTYDSFNYHGKDIINLSKNEKMSIDIYGHNYNYPEDYSYYKKDNNLVIKENAKTYYSFAKNNYSYKAVCEASKLSKRGYSTVKMKIYSFNEKTGKYRFEHKTTLHCSKGELKEYGIKQDRTTKLYFELKDNSSIYDNNILNEIDYFTKKSPKLIKHVATKVTINNYFKYFNNCDINFKDMGTNLTEELKSGDKYIYLKGGEKITGTGVSDYIVADKKTKSINAGEGNNVIDLEKAKNSIKTTAGTGNDEYSVNTSSKLVQTINDKGGEDYLNLHYDFNDYLFIFNVAKNENTNFQKEDFKTLYIACKYKYSSVYEDDDQFMNGIAKVCNKEKNLRNNVLINNYFNNDGSNGSGTIEHIGNVDNRWDLSRINTVRQNVASWLNNTKYTSSMQVFHEGNVNEITQLLQIYDAITK